MKKILVILFSFFVVALYSQRDFSKVEIKTTKISDQIYMLEGSGGNIGVFTGNDATLMIDDQFAPLSEKIKAAITEISNQPVKYLVNTHWHGDHSGGNENFANDGAVIFAHKNVRVRKSTEQVNKAFNRVTPPAPEAAWPQITFQEDMTLHINGEDVHLIHVHDSHTDGDSFVYFTKSNVLHMGDCFFNGRFPYIDLGSGGTIDGIIVAVQTALMLSDQQTKIIPGHGALASKNDLIEYHNMLLTMRDRVKNAIAEGQSIEEMKAAKLDEGYEDWGKAFISGERIVDIIWTDMTRDEKE